MSGNGQQVTELVARLGAVDWSGAGASGHVRSREALLREHLRRLSLWAGSMNQERPILATWPFLDVASTLAPNLKLPGKPYRELEHLIGSDIGAPQVGDCCRCAFSWAALVDRVGAPPGGRRNDPYEPIIVFFERGGGFTVRERLIDLGGATVDADGWPQHRATDPITGLDPLELDALDAS